MQVIYPAAYSAFARGQIDWTSDTFKVVLLDNTYTYSSAHDYYDDLTGVLGTAVTLTGCVEIGNGICDANDLSVSGVSVGDIAERLVIYQVNGSAATDLLIYYSDSNSDGTPFYRVSDGNPIAISWDNGSGRIFAV